MAAQGPVKNVSRAQLYRYLRAAKIQPLGIRKKPQIYPEDSVPRLMAYLGLKADCTGILPLQEIKRRAKGKAQVFAVMAKAGVNTLTLKSRKGGGK